MSSRSEEKGFCRTFQSFLFFVKSEPKTPRSGMKGTPFSVACSAVWIAERHGARLDLGDAACADEKVGAQAEHRRAQQAQIPRFLSNEAAHDLHRRHGIVRRHRDERAVGDQRGEIAGGAEKSRAVRLQ